tara:strand:+ start:8389 stop:14283 length:5895 start_codon:yes stop_codon:yes gene_type:complete
MKQKYIKVGQSESDVVELLEKQQQRLGGGIVIAVFITVGVVVGLTQSGGDTETIRENTATTETIRVIDEPIIGEAGIPVNFSEFTNAEPNDCSRIIGAPRECTDGPCYTCECSSENTCQDGYECQPDDLAAGEVGQTCLKRSGRGCIWLDKEEFQCIECPSQTTCTADPTYYCKDNNTCAAGCGAIFTTRTTPDEFEFDCDCTQDSNSSNACPYTHMCTNNKCSLLCEHRKPLPSSPFEYTCLGCDSGTPPVNPCRPGFECKANVCRMRCDHQERPGFQDYECEGFNNDKSSPDYNPCIPTHIFDEDTETCVWNSCGSPTENTCHCTAENPCPDGYKCALSANNQRYSSCQLSCDVVPDGDFNNFYSCTGCTADYQVNRTLADEQSKLSGTLFNPCAEGYRCNPDSGCTYIDGPAGFTQGFDKSDVCLTDGSIGFLGYAHWQLIPDDPECADGSGVSDRRCIDDTDPNNVAGSSLACKCADIHNILDPSTGCSPFLQHTTFGRNLLFDYLPSDGLNNGKRGIISTELMRVDEKETCAGGTTQDLKDFKKLFAFISGEESTNTREERFEQTSDNAIADTNCIEFRTHETKGKNRGTRVGMGSLPSYDRVADYFTGGPENLVDAVAFERIRDKFYENEIYYGDADETELGDVNYFASAIEKSRLTLYEIITRYVKSENIIKCKDLPGVLYNSNKENVAQPYKNIFSQFMTKLSSQPMYAGTNGPEKFARKVDYKQDVVTDIVIADGTYAVIEELVECSETVPCQIQWPYPTWEVFQDKYPGISNGFQNSNKEKTWTALDVMLHQLNEGIPYDFQVTSENWQDQLCVWNGEAAHPIGVANVQGSVMKTDRSGSTGSFCLNCRIKGSDGSACKGSTCSTTEEISSFEATRGECGRQPNPDKCMCQHPLDAEIYEDQHGFFQLHWSSWESNMVRDTNGDSAGQCGKAVKCYANPDPKEFSNPKSVPRGELDPKTDFSKFQPFEYFSIGSQMEATCRCLHPNYYSAKTNQYDYCESLSVQNKERTDLARCGSNAFTADLYPHGNHYPHAIDVLCDCNGGFSFDVTRNECVKRQCIPEKSGQVFADLFNRTLVWTEPMDGWSKLNVNTRHEPGSSEERMLKRDDSTGQECTVDSSCDCSCRIDERRPENTDVDDTVDAGTLTLIHSYYGNTCEKTVSCYDHNIPGKETTTVVKSGESSTDTDPNPERVCKCPDDEFAGSFIISGFVGEKCQYYYTCGDGFLEFENDVTRTGPRCSCNSSPLHGMTAAKVNENTDRFVKAYIAYYGSDDNKKKPSDPSAELDITKIDDFIQARRRLLHGYWESDDCESEYHHCVWGEVQTGTDCPNGQDQCCSCFTHWTGEYCDLPCGFMCTTDEARYPDSSSFSYKSNTDLWLAGTWMGRSDPNTGNCLSQELSIYNDYTCVDGSCARKDVFGATKLGVKRQIERALPCGDGEDPWLDLFEPICKTVESVENTGFYAGPDKLFDKSTREMFLYYTDKTHFETHGKIPAFGSTSSELEELITNDLAVNGWEVTSTKDPDIDEAANEHNTTDCVEGDVVGEEVCENNEPDTPFNLDKYLTHKAMRVVKYAKRISWFAHQAQIEDRDRGGWTTDDYARLPPWFRSDSGGIISHNDPLKNGFADKCDHPEEFPKGSLDEQYWGFAIERITTNEPDREGDGNDIEMYNIQIRMKYTDYSERAQINYNKNGGLPRGLELRPAIDSEFTAFKIFPDDDDDFDCYEQPEKSSSGQRFAEDYVGVTMMRNEEESLSALRSRFDALTKKIKVGDQVNKDGTKTDIYGFEDEHWYNTLKAQFPSSGGRFEGCKIPYGPNYLHGDSTYDQQYFRHDNLPHIHITGISFKDWDFWSGNDDHGGDIEPNTNWDPTSDCSMRGPDKKDCEMTDMATDMYNDWTEDRETGKYFKWFRFKSKHSKNPKERRCDEVCRGHGGYEDCDWKNCREERAQIFVKLVRTKYFL